MPDLSSEQTTQLFRIIQESLTNVVRHAQASQVKVVIDLDDEEVLHISISDNGNGFNVKEVGFQSLGLIGMQERARNIGALLEIENKPDKSTTVMLSLSPNATKWIKQE